MKEKILTKMGLPITTGLFLVVIFLLSFFLYKNEYTFLSNDFLENFFYLLGFYLFLLVICSVFSNKKERIIYIVFSVSIAISMVVYYFLLIILIGFAGVKN